MKARASQTHRNKWHDYDFRLQSRSEEDFGLESEGGHTLAGVPWSVGCLPAGSKLDRRGGTGCSCGSTRAERLTSLFKDDPGRAWGWPGLAAGVTGANHARKGSVRREARGWSELGRLRVFPERVERG